ncbi:hypothetical protein GLW08_12615 [Pontibacillus yanchengensis]|uniref:Uncharacterized protein n=1 Tax=Pontibacillus yanchengensis TaxID=462910 RepID=A0ACC7VHT2_9BACI|nr:hypothetical protein [Pontibacillus yanchengensis]MYL54180.1 hypothetical protein [Pontibacillus yanchengensis]
MFKNKKEIRELLEKINEEVNISSETIFCNGPGKIEIEKLNEEEFRIMGYGKTPGNRDQDYSYLDKEQVVSMIWRYRKGAQIGFIN